MSDPQLITLSRATYVGASGATAAATYSFFTEDYEPPSQDRAIEYDVVINQNGKFKYIYDNGPGFKKWSPFKIHCEERIGSSMLGQTAAQQYANLVTLWEHPGVLGMKAPEGTYIVHWGDDIENNFVVFPITTSQVREYEVQVQFEEGQ